MTYYFVYVYVASVTQEYLVYITKTGLVGLSLNNNTLHDVLPISSKQNVLDVDFDTLNKTMYIVQSPEVGNVSQRQKRFDIILNLISNFYNVAH